MIGLWIALMGSAGSGPTAPPFNVRTELYAGTKIALRWLPGDEQAATNVYRLVGSTWTYVRQEAAGVRYSETGYTSGRFAVAHFKNGQLTELVEADVV
jgi:hypothetical protein